MKETSNISPVTVGNPVEKPAKIIGIYIDMAPCGEFEDLVNILIMDSASERITLSCDNSGVLSCVRAPRPEFKSEIKETPK